MDYGFVFNLPMSCLPPDLFKNPEEEAEKAKLEMKEEEDVKNSKNNVNDDSDDDDSDSEGGFEEILRSKKRAKDYTSQLSSRGGMYSGNGSNTQTSHR